MLCTDAGLPHFVKPLLARVHVDVLTVITVAAWFCPNTWKD